MRTTTASPSPFARAALKIWEQGYSPLPIVSGTKRPAIDQGWTKFCDVRASAEQLAEWLQAPSLGIGVALGGAVVAIDIETDDPEIVDLITNILPPGAVSKRGRKGRTDFFHDPTHEIASRKLRSANQSGGLLVEILARGNQTIIPPSVHPDTGQPYLWLTQATLENTPPGALPRLRPDIAARLEDALAPWLARRRSPSLIRHEIASPAGRPTSHYRAYADFALEEELIAFGAMAPGSGRNSELYRLTCRFGRFAHHGIMPHTQLVGALLEGCRSNGLLREDGEHACRMTITSGLRASQNDALPELDRKVNPASFGDHAADGKLDVLPDMSIVRRNCVPAPIFPLHVLGQAASWVRETAECKSAAVDFVALSLLVSIAGLIGPKRFVSPWEEWSEPCVLWGALVAPPSMNKSPATDPVRSAIRQIETEVNAGWEADKAEYEKRKKLAESSYAKWAAEVSVAANAGNAAPDLPIDALAPKIPLRRRIWITDATTEKIAQMLAQPGGLLCFRDELSGLIGAFDRYGGHGADRAFWIEAYGGRSHRLDRVRLDETIDIQFCAVSILGGIQPDRLRTLLLAGDDDGLAARFLYAWPDVVAPRRPTAFPDTTVLLDALRRLSEITFDRNDDASLRPRTIVLDPEAADEFQGWWEGDQWRAKNESSGLLGSAIGKLDGTTLRLAQVLEYLNWSWLKRNVPEPDRVSVQCVRGAIELVESWVRPMLLRVFTETSMPKARRDATTIARWLLSNPPLTSLNARELRRSPKSPAPREATELDAALSILREAGWLIESEGRQGSTRGRTRKDYLVNPRIYTEPT